MFRGDGVTAHNSNATTTTESGRFSERGTVSFRKRQAQNPYYKYEIAVHTGEHALFMLVKAATTTSVVKNRRQKSTYPGPVAGLVVVLQRLYILACTLSHAHCVHKLDLRAVFLSAVTFLVIVL